MERTACFTAVELALHLAQFTSNLTESCAIALRVSQVPAVILEIALVVGTLSTTRCIRSKLLAAVLDFRGILLDFLVGFPKFFGNPSLQSLISTFFDLRILIFPASVPVLYDVVELTQVNLAVFDLLL